MKLNALASCGALLALLTLNSNSNADLPPPEGTKFVGYSFVVDNVGAFPDFVVFAYPWSLSNGAPTREHIRIGTDRPIKLGRRSPTPKLYAMPRAAYEAWDKTHKPKDDGEDDPALDALVKRPDVVLCTGAPTPRFSLASDDKREDILEKLSAKKIAAGVCEISTALSPSPEPEATPAPTPTPTVAPDVPPSTNPTSAQDPAAPPGKSGCGSCSVGSAGDTSSGALLALLLGALLTRRRRP